MTDDLGRGLGSDSDTAADTAVDAGMGGDAVIGAMGDDSLIGQTQVTVEQPASGEIVRIATEAGQSYVLDFDPGQAQALVQGDDLILIFPDGGRIVFENLVALVQLEDGPSLLASGTDIIPLLVAQGIIPGVADGFVLNEPDPGETIVVTAEAGQRYVINFDPAVAQVRVDGDNLVLVFPNGGRIVIEDLGSIPSGPGEPVFGIAGNDVPGSTLFGQAVALSGEEAGPEGPATLETAAGGEGPIGTGATQYDDYLGDPINLLNAQGVIPPRELQFGVPELEPGPVEPGPGEPTLDVTILTNVPEGDVNGVFQGTFEDGAPNQHVGDTQDVWAELIIVFTPGAGEELISLTIAGIPGDARVAVGGTDPADEVFPVGGSITLTPEQLAAGVFFLPGDNDSDADIPLTFTADFVRDGVPGSVSATGTAVFDAVADKPQGDLFQGEGDGEFFAVSGEGGQLDNFFVSGGEGDSLDATDGGASCLTEDGTVFVEVDALFGDFLDGSETHTYVIEGVPDDWTENFDSTAVTGVDFVKQPDGTWLATVSGDGPAGWISFDTNGWTGETTLTVKAVATETNLSGGELTLANNEAEIAGTVTLCIDEDTPIVGAPTNLLVDEDDLVPDGTDQTPEPAGDRVDEGQVTVDFFSDQPADLTGAFAFTGGSPASGPNGEAITYTPSGDGQSLTASIDGVDIFTVTVTGATPNGGGNVTYDYQVTLLAEMDHLVGDNGENFFDFTADFTVTDSDGDSDGGSFDVRVVDDVPETTQNLQSGVVEEEHLPTGNEDEDDLDGLDDDVDPNFDATTTVATGSLAGLVTIGADQPGSFNLDVIPNNAPEDSGLTSGGATVWYVSDGATLTAFVDEGDGEFGAGDTTIFTLALSGSNNETWTFTLEGPLDHHAIPAADDVEGNLEIDFSGRLSAVDDDGDTVDLGARALVVTVIDDIPIAADDSAAGDVGGADVTGNVLDGADGAPDTDDAGEDSAGADGVGVIRSITHDGVTYTLSDDGTTVTDDGAPVLGVDYLFDGTTLTIVETAAGGSFSIDLQGADVGDYSYSPPASDPAAASDAFAYVLEDGDGDADSATLTISLDDAPSFDAGTVLTHDETAGIQQQPPGIDDDLNGNAEDDIDPTISGLPGDLQTTLGDLSIVQGDIVGVAQDTVTFAYGANGPAASDPVKLSVVQGTQSTLFATTGDADDGGTTGDESRQPIYLYQISANVIVGVLAVWDGDNWVDPDTLNDDAIVPIPDSDYVTVDASLADIAYVIYMGDPAAPSGTDNDSSADVYFVQTAAIWNDNPDDPDESDNSILPEDQSVSVVVTDADDDSVTGSFTVRGEDDGPTIVAAQTSTGIVEDEHLAGGNEDENPAQDADTGGNFDLTTDTASGSLSGLVDFGTDGVGSFAFGDDTSSLEAQNLSSGGVDLSYTVNGTNTQITADAGGTPVFTLTLNPLTGAWVFTLLAPLDHLDDDLEDLLTIDFSGVVVATDGDGDSVSLDPNTFEVTVIDDIPLNFSPDQAVLGSNGEFPVIVTEDLDWFDNVGADKPGDVTFDPALDGVQLFEDDTVTAVTSNGFDIYLELSGDGHTLTGWADSDESGDITAEDDMVFTVVLNPDAVNEGSDEYTVTLFDKIDTGAQVVFDNFGDVDAGGPQEWIALDDPRTGADDMNQDILFTAGPVSDKVNTSTQGIGVQNQQVDNGEIIRIDFVSNVNPGDLNDASPGAAGDIADLTYDSHYTVNDSGFGISQSFGATQVTVTAIDADDDNIFFGDAAGESTDTITSVTVLDELGQIIVEDATTNTVVGGIGIVFNPDGTVTVSGLLLDYQVLVSTADGFNALQIECDTVKFDLGGIVVSSAEAGDPVNMDFGVIGEDEDGDTSTGTVEVTVLPQITGTDGAETLTATANGSDLLGMDGADTLVGGAAADKLQGGGGVDTISDGAGADLILGGDGADIINLAADNETDVLVYDALSEAGDTVNGFDTDAPGNGDLIDITDLLDSGGVFTGTTLSEAEAGGFVQIIDNGGNAELQVDLDGGGNSWTTVVTVTSVLPADLSDNVVVD